MIPELLWRCPLCATNDALDHLSRWLRPDLINCSHCEAQWHLKRVPGDNFYLKLVDIPEQNDKFNVGEEFSLPYWYDTMKASIELIPIPGSEIPMEDGEVLYLASGRVELAVEETDPLFFPNHPNDSQQRAKKEIGGKSIGPGRVFLTNRRLIWQGDRDKVGICPPLVSFHLEKIFSAQTFFGLVLQIGMRLYMLFFPEESMLKWVTYVDLVSLRWVDKDKHKIKTSHY